MEVGARHPTRRQVTAFGFLPVPELYELPLGNALLGGLMIAFGPIGLGVIWTAGSLFALLCVSAWRQG
jgi:hypothetical protein